MEINRTTRNLPYYENTISTNQNESTAKPVSTKGGTTAMLHQIVESYIALAGSTLCIVVIDESPDLLRYDEESLLFYYSQAIERLPSQLGEDLVKGKLMIVKRPSAGKDDILFRFFQVNKVLCDSGSSIFLNSDAECGHAMAAVAEVARSLRWIDQTCTLMNARSRKSVRASRLFNGWRLDLAGLIGTRSTSSDCPNSAAFGVHFSYLDVTHPYLVVKASFPIDAMDLRRRLARHVGISCSANIPKLALIEQPRSKDSNLYAEVHDDNYGQVPHPNLPLTCLLTLSVAAVTADSVVQECLRPFRQTLVVDNPSGRPLQLKLTMDRTGTIRSAETDVNSCVLGEHFW